MKNTYDTFTEFESDVLAEKKHVDIGIWNKAKYKAAKVGYNTYPSGTVVRLDADYDVQYLGAMTLLHVW